MSDPINGAIGDIMGLPLWVAEPFHHLAGCPGGTPMTLFGGKQSCAFCVPCNVAHNLALSAARDAVAALPANQRRSNEDGMGGYVQHADGMGTAVSHPETFTEYLTRAAALAAIDALRGES